MSARARQAGRLMDCSTVARELGISQAAAEALMRQVPKVTIAGLRKTYVRRADVDRYLDERTAS